MAQHSYLSVTVLALLALLGLYAASLAFGVVGLPSGSVISGLWATTGLLVGSGAVLVLTRQQDRRGQRLLQQYGKELNFGRQAINAHTIVNVSERTGEIIEVNENFTRLFGYSADEVLGHELSFIYENGEEDPVFQEMMSCSLAGTGWTGEQRLRTKDGAAVYTQCTMMPLFDEDGQHSRNITLRTDVTASRRAEADHYLTVVLEELKDEVFIYDTAEHVITYMNAAARRRTGWEDGARGGRRIDEAISDIDPGVFAEHIAPLTNGRDSIVRLECRDDAHALEVATQRITAPGGKPLYVSVIRDITERRAVEKAKLDMVSTVSHELRAPLTSIKGSLRMLQSGALGTFEGRANTVIEIAARNSERLLLVLNDILDLDKIRAKQMDFTRESMTLGPLLQSAIDMNSGYGEEHGVRFRLDDPTSDARIMGNADRLMQVLTNLMSNAAKFSPQDGEVRVGLRDQGDVWQIFVRDSGPGIAESDRPRVFDTFAQLKPADGRPRSGTGLGLAICKSIVERHDGEIDFVSQIGHGTEFRVDLPKAAGPERNLTLERLAS